MNAALPTPPVSGSVSRAVTVKTIIGPTTGILVPFIKVPAFLIAGLAFLKELTSFGSVILNSFLRNLFVDGGTGLGLGMEGARPGVDPFNEGGNGLPVLGLIIEPEGESFGAIPGLLRGISLDPGLEVGPLCPGLRVEPLCPGLLPGPPRGTNRFASSLANLYIAFPSLKTFLITRPETFLSDLPTVATNLKGALIANLSTPFIA